MADVSGAPRRVSIAYILGFSNKPFKDGGPPAAPPAPRHPSAFKRMVTTPGGVIEWAASDGRRGRLTGPSKPCLTAADLTQLSEGNQASLKAASKKAAEEDDGGFFGPGLFDDTPAAPVSGAANEKPDSSEWTKEQDEKLLQLRSEHPNRPWCDIAEAIDNGQQAKQCKERFKKIIPKGWKPNNVKGGDGGKQKHNQVKQKKQNDSEKKEAEKKANDGDLGFDASGSLHWPASSNTGGGGDGNDSWDKSEGNNGAIWCAGQTEAINNNGCQNKADDGFKDDNNGWDPIPVDNGATSGCGHNAGTEKDAWANSNDTSANVDDLWNTEDPWNKPANDASKDSTSKKTSFKNGLSSIKNLEHLPNKAPSQSGSKYRSSQSSVKPPASPQKEYELRPDSTFSADDLRVIAKILQQDCQMVWNRVSWRFKDKTGRNLDPDVFEGKITGIAKYQGSKRDRR